MQDASCYAFINTGIRVLSPSQDPVLYAMLNTGVNATATTVPVMYSYLNLGLPVPHQRSVVHGPRGWGILPVEKQEFTVFTAASTDSCYAYIDTTN